MHRHIILVAVLALFIYAGCGKSDGPAAPSGGGAENTAVPSPTITQTPALSFTFTPTRTATPNPVVTADAYEQDDTPATAKTITGGAVQSRSADACDEEDWVTFTLATSADVTISTSGTTFATYIEVFDDAAKTNYIFGAGSGSGPATASQNSLPAGTYYADIRAYNYASPGCDVFNYTLSFSVTLLPAATATETDTLTATDTATPVNTNTSTASYTETHTATGTHSPTFTVTNTGTITSTPSPAGDAYEPDNTAAFAKAITPGVTQNRNTCPMIDEDWASFSVGTESSVRASASGFTGNMIIGLYNSSQNVMCYEYDCSAGPCDAPCVLAPGSYYIHTKSFSCTSYDLDLTIETVTPSYTVTNTPTYTNTDTAIPTVTHTPTQTATAYWSSAGAYGFNNSGYLRTASDGTNFSLSYTNAGTLYADTGASVAASSEPSYYGREMTARRGADTLVAYTDSSANIYVKSSADTFSSYWGGSSAGKGYYPCIAADGNTVYAVYNNIAGGTDMRISVMYSYSNGSWQQLGSDVYNQTDDINRRLSMDLVNSDPHDIYVAYLNESAAAYVKHYNGSAWSQAGSNQVFSGGVSHVDVEAVNAGDVFCAASLTDFTIRVKKLSAGSWADAGTNPVVPAATAGSVEFWLYAVSASEVYLAYQQPSNAYMAVKRYNGSIWENLGNSSGISASNISTPCIFKAGGSVLCGYVDWSQLGLIQFLQLN